MNSRIAAADAVYLKKTEIHTLKTYLTSYFTEKPVSKRAPKRRCSSHTFRYGYLVTT